LTSWAKVIWAEGLFRARERREPYRILGENVLEIEFCEDKLGDGNVIKFEAYVNKEKYYEMG
jgi:hypothetical protein